MAAVAAPTCERAPRGRDHTNEDRSMDIHKLAVRRQSIRMLNADELRIARGVRDGGHGGNTKTKPKLTTRPPGRRRRIAALTTVTSSRTTTAP